MAEPDPPFQLPEAPFPAPPPFWRHFTVANEAQLRRHESTEQADTKLPIPLAYLRPPPPPPIVAENYTTFGQKQVIDPTKPSSLPLDELLFDPNQPKLDHAFLLKKLTTSLLLNFLELSTILSLNPTQYQEKLDDFRQLFLNVHVVINMYRPHQARESAKDLLESRLEDGQREIDECDNLKLKIQTFLDEIAQFQNKTPAVDGLNGNETSSSSREIKDDKMEEQQRLWKMVQDMKDV
jgi:mediator of RNA polymerase II transcription subunit 7